MGHLIDGRIPAYNVVDEFDLLLNLPKCKPSRRIIDNKKGLKAIKALMDIKDNNNISWYQYLKECNKDNLDSVAIFYRGNKITFRQLFSKVEEVKKSLSKSGLVQGDEIGVCVSNTPELIYLLCAANDLGLVVNSFVPSYKKQFLRNKIFSKINKKVFFISDDNYERIKDVISEYKFDNVVITSLADSLPKDPTKCDEYEPELDSYYRYDNKALIYSKDKEEYATFNNYLENAKDYNGPIIECGNLETDFLKTYTSGSTSEPKAIIHKNRSLITIAKFHDPELCGNPKIPGLRGLALIHPDSNTDLITCISDNLCQGWSVATEPEGDINNILDIMFINKPNYANLTTTYAVEMMKQYLVDKRFYDRTMPFFLALFCVGEGMSRGEEKFINKGLRKAKAGSGVNIMKHLRLPSVPASIGGGDCEHGGIYYTLWKAYYQLLYKVKLGNDDIGLFPVPYAVVTALKKDIHGNWVECDYNESGVIVANSYTNLSCYDDNEEATEDLIIEDNYGRKWVTCNVHGYIDNIGGVHVKGRVPSKDKVFNRTYLIDDIICKDTKNILSSSTVEDNGKLVCTIQFQPLGSINKDKTIKSMYERLHNRFHEYVVNSIYVRILPTRMSYKTANSGKRSITALEQMGMIDTELLTDMIKEEKTNTKKLVS